MSTIRFSFFFIKVCMYTMQSMHLDYLACFLLTFLLSSIRRENIDVSLVDILFSLDNFDNKHYSFPC